MAGHSGLREAGRLLGGGLSFDVRVGLEGDFGEDLARALTGYLSLHAKKRQRYREIVRRDSVESLSWALWSSKWELAEGKG